MGYFSTNTKNVTKKTTLYIGTYNIRLLSTDIHLTDLNYETQNIKWDFIGFRKMKRPGEELITRDVSLFFLLIPEFVTLRMKGCFIIIFS